jgi:hypothetical protein
MRCTLASLAVLALAVAPAMVRFRQRGDSAGPRKTAAAARTRLASTLSRPSQNSKPLLSHSAQAAVVDEGKTIKIVGDGKKSFNKTLPKLVLPKPKDFKKPVRWTFLLFMERCRDSTRLPRPGGCYGLVWPS